MSNLIIPGAWIFAFALLTVIVLVLSALYIYEHQRLKSVVNDAKNVAKLAAECDMLSAQKEELIRWISEQKSELERLIAEREEQERLRSELDHLEQQCIVKEEQIQELRREVGELESQRHLLAKSIGELKKEKENIESYLNKHKPTIDKLKDELKRQEFKLNELIKEVWKNQEEKEKILSSIAEKKVELMAVIREKESLELKLEKLEDTLNEYYSKLEPVKKKIEELQNELNELVEEIKIKNQEKEVIISQLLENRMELSKLTSEKEALMKKLQELNQGVDSAKQEQELAKKDLAKYQEQIKEVKEKLDKLKQELSEKRKHWAELDVQVRYLQQREMELEKKLSNFAYGKDKSEKEPYKDLLEVEPKCLSVEFFPSGATKVNNEIEAIERLEDALEEESIMFPKRVIYAFHTCLKCYHINTLTVLAGVSGTGKTLLPIYYARMMGMHSLVLSVQPRWDSPQDLFGFYNYLEGKYKATELSRALIRLDPYNYPREEFPMLHNEKIKDRMLLVLLDEMNLARTEYYFSDFLSKLELRRMVKDPAKKSDREKAEIILDTGPDKSFRIWVGDNVLFVGTMNEDETTQSLSDKILDRANVLRFGKPDSKMSHINTQLQDNRWSREYLPYRVWRSWIKTVDKHVPWFKDVDKWTNQLNEALDKVGRPFGFRTHQAILNYVANYPLIDENNKAYKLAFADQIEQKIIPKLRGIDITENLSNNCLDDIETILDKIGDHALSEAFRNARKESRTVGMFQWRGVSRSVNEEV